MVKETRLAENFPADLKGRKDRPVLLIAGVIVGLTLFQALGSYIALQALIERGILERRGASLWIVVFSSLFMATALTLFVLYLWRTKRKSNQSPGSSSGLAPGSS